MDDQSKTIQTILPHPIVDIFRIHHQPYYIFSLEYRQNSAGLRAYYYLCHILNEMGYEAYVVSDKPIPGIRAPILTHEIWKFHKKEGRRPIAVYGETTQGNPLMGDTVVRWILNTIGHIGASVRFNDNDLVFYWDRIFACSAESVNLLHLPVIDRSIFHRKGVADSERQLLCYYAHKYFYFSNGQVDVSRKIKDNCISLCQDVQMTHVELAETLRRTKVLYCYELSAIASEAVFCGCPVVIIKTDYLNNYNLESQEFVPPIVLEDEIDFDYIPECIDEYIDYLSRKEINSWKTINNFVELTQRAAAEIDSTDSVKDVLLSFCEHYSQIYIYGTGYVAKHCYLVLSIIGINIAGFVVSDNINDNVYREGMLFGFPVFRLSEISHSQCDCGFILAMLTKNEDEVTVTLIKRGIKNYLCYSLLLN